MHGNRLNFKKIAKNQNHSKFLLKLIAPAPLMRRWVVRSCMHAIATLFSQMLYFFILTPAESAPYSLYIIKTNAEFT